MSDIICRTVGELKQALAELPDDLPFEVYYEGHCCRTEFLTLRGIWDGKEGVETLVIDADDDTPTPKLAGKPMWPGIVPIPEYLLTASTPRQANLIRVVPGTPTAGVDNRDPDTTTFCASPTCI